MKKDADNRDMLHVRVDKGLVKRIDFLAVEGDCFRGEAVERILAWAVTKIEGEYDGHIPQPESSAHRKAWALVAR